MQGVACRRGGAERKFPGGAEWDAYGLMLGAGHAPFSWPSSWFRV